MARKHLTRSPERAVGSERGLLAHPVDTLRGLVDRLESFLEKPFEYFGGAFEPRFDIEQSPKELVISARLPGYSKDDIVVDLTADSVTVRGCKSREKKGRKHGGYIEEREETTFARSMTLPDSVKTSEARASYKGGKLEIRLPRAKEAHVRRVEVG